MIREKPALLEAFAERERELGKSGPQWLRQRRREALERFEQLGFPTSRIEEWKATNVAPIERTTFVPAPDAQETADLGDRLAALELDGVAPHRLVLINGRVSTRLSTLDRLPDGVSVSGLDAATAEGGDDLEPHLAREASFETRPFTALNTALFEDGASVVVADGVELPDPILVLHLTAAGRRPLAAFPRTLARLGRSARATLIEAYVSANGGVYFNDSVSEFVLDDNSSLQHCRLQEESRDAFHIGTLQTRQGRDSRLNTINLDLGAALARLDTVAVLDGEGAGAELDGLYLTSGSQHVDNHTTLDHARAHCYSRELYKGILADRSRAVFNGRILVRPGAQKTDAKQSNPNLLLSDESLVQTRPQLEIYADDVKCTHGATIGRLDPNALFYLRSRGLGADEAQHLLIRAFAGEVLDRLEVDPLRTRLERRIAERLARIEQGKDG